MRVDLLPVQLLGSEKGLPDLGRIQRFFYVVYGLQPDRGLQIFLVGVAAHENRHGVGQCLLELLQHRDPVHPGHPHVAQNDLRPVFPRDLESVKSVVRLEDLIHAERGPVERRDHAGARQFLVVCNQ